MAQSASTISSLLPQLLLEASAPVREEGAALSDPLSLDYPNGSHQMAVTKGLAPSPEETLSLQL
jgi:hypothetical protein